MLTTRARMPSVLIVEDERIVAKDLQQTLAGLGYDAFAIAASADEAIARATERCPDVVFMDIRIKGKRDGIETAQVLRSRFDVPVVYLTAHADDATIARAKKTEPLGYLMKPVRAADLRSAIEVSLYVHEMEKQLRERERWYATTLCSMADAVIAVDLMSNITFVNPAAEQLIGMKRDEVLGQPVQAVMQLVDPQARALLETPLETALREERSVMISEVGLVNAATGAVRIIGDNAAPVVDGGRMLGAVMVFRDVTEEKRIQKQLELADRLASLGTMAAGVAHEVNNPLAVVVANAAFVDEELGRCLEDLARNDNRPGEAVRGRFDEISRALADLQSAGSRIGRIVADLRAFSRPVARTGRADVIQAVEWAIRATATELRHRAGLVTALDAAPAVTGEESRLGQVFVNLLINAAHAIAPGHASENQVRVSTRTDEAGRAVVEIRDTGSGIPDSIRDRIFEPFFTTKPVGSGTGLGLSICTGIIHSFGGEIQVQSRAGEGTTFRVILPPAAEEEREQPPAAATARRGRILVVDDEEMVLRAIKRVLRDHDVVCLPGAREALALLDAGERFDIILSDVVMQVMSGIDFYEALLRRHPELARSLVFLSGGAISTRMEDFLRAVPNLRLEKPIEVAHLLDTVRRLLAEKSPPD
jgi:PAS domain S-box-containing protein